MPQMMRGMNMAGGAGHSKQASFAGSPQDAFAQALRAVQSSGGEVMWQQAPVAGKYLLTRKNWWSTGGVALKYDGEFAVQPAGPGQTNVRFSLKLQWNSAVPLLLLQIVAVIVLAMMNPYVMYFALILIGVTLALTAWNSSSGIPDKALNDLVKNFNGGIAMAQHTPQPQMHTPAPPPPQPAPAAAPTPPPAADATSSIVDQIKQLAGLRDAGAITADEFEAKKAELLKRI